MHKGFFGPYMDALLTAACSISFFGFVRCGEFTSTSAHLDDTSGLPRGDITHNHPIKSYVTQMKIRLNSSKTDPFRFGVSISLFQVNCIACPITAAIHYLRRRDAIPGLSHVNSPLLCLANGEPLTRKLLVNSLNRLCQACGLNTCHYSSHSMRIGAATSAAQQHMADHLIQMLRRWSSDCYKTYIRTSPTVLLKAHKTLANIHWLSCCHVPRLPNPSTKKATSMGLPTLWHACT